MRSRSAAVSVGFSPVVPHGQRKWMPASICRRPSRRTAPSSSAPLRVNGVTSAVPTPVNGVLIGSLRQLNRPAMTVGRPEGLHYRRALQPTRPPRPTRPTRPPDAPDPPDFPGPPDLPGLPGLPESEHVLHREPAALTVDPPRRGERAVGERAAIACGVGQHHG